MANATTVNTAHAPAVTRGAPGAGIASPVVTAPTTEVSGTAGATSSADESTAGHG